MERKRKRQGYSANFQRTLDNQGAARELAAKRVLDKMGGHSEPRGRCPVCETSVWLIGDVCVLGPYHGGPFVATPTPLVPVVPVTCKNCGNVLLFNALKLGLLDAEGAVSEDVLALARQERELEEERSEGLE